MTVRSGILGILIIGLGGGCSTKSTTDGGAVVQPDGNASADGPSATLNEMTVTLYSMGINFDDLAYSNTLHKLLVPGALTGNLYLVDVGTNSVTTIPGFDNEIPDGGMDNGGPPDGFMLPDGFMPPDGGFRFFRQAGLTSVAEGNGLLYTTDRSNNVVYIVDPTQSNVLGKVALEATPDFVRYVAATNELWVNEPSMHNIEVLSVSTDGKTVTHSSDIPVPNGPEGIYIDKTHGVAFTNARQQTVVIDLTKKTVTGMWAGGCQRPGPFAADEANNLLFIGCGENGVVSIDVSDLTNGKKVSEIRNASQPQGLSFVPSLRHLYLPGPSTDIVAVSKTGKLQNQGGVPTPYAERLAVADDQGNFWVPEQIFGAVLRVRDPVPASNN